MTFRLVLFSVLVCGLVGLYLGVRLGGRLRRQRRVGRLSDPRLSQGTPTVLFFTGEFCTVCHYRQQPALEALAAEMGEGLRVVEYDAAREAELTRRFGVLSLPTTVVLSHDGTVRAINYGFATTAQLRAQLRP